ncbi:MAG: ribonuclease Y [Proteobacteria bacterium]|nr:ribonuclease Y [Pseudomonadota bacterium]
MDIAIGSLVAVVGVLFGLFVVGVFLHKKQLAVAFKKAEDEAKQLREEARKEADTIVKQALKDAKDEARTRRQQFEDEQKNRRGEINKLEAKIKQREQQLEKKLELVEKRESELSTTEQRLSQEELHFQKMNAECGETLENARRTLQNVAKMSAEEAKRELIRTLEDEARKEARGRLQQIEEQARKDAEERARSVVSLAVQRVAGEFVSDATISVVSLPSDDMKGRIIGREGRNIRALEQATGVDLIIDDTPEAVILSCFNPIRREIAKISLERLVADGRIHPARIEETAKRVTTEFDQIIREAGEQAAFDIGITDLHPELIKHLGRLKYRTVGVQTILQHAVETAQLCGIMASEMGLNVKRAKRCGLLHDIGKAVDQDTEGHHAQIGADLCARCDESEVVVDAIRLHHDDDINQASPYAVVLHTANVLSSKRPGARREVMETYLTRLGDMEKLIKGFEGIEDAYVMQAGNEVRAMVKPSGVSDHDCTDLANDIAAKLRQEITFPGQVRVTVVRESRVTDFAK